jgi:hypothetical protein
MKPGARNERASTIASRVREHRVRAGRHGVRVIDHLVESDAVHP